jgi:drug/metabolite transporter (DMT)-like permease
MFLFVKFMADTNTFVLVFYRSIIQCAISLSVLLVGRWRNQQNLAIDDSSTTTTTSISLRQVVLGPSDCETRFYLTVRGSFGASAICAWYYGIQHLPLPDAVTLQFTNPPFAAVFAVCLVGEPWRILDRIGAVVCLLGVALIAHPTWLFGGYHTNNEENNILLVDDLYDDDLTNTINSTILVAPNEDPQQRQHSMAVMVTLAGAAMAGLAYVSVRKIGHKAPAMVMVWYDGALCLPIVLIGSGIMERNLSVWRFDRELSMTDFILILFMGISAFGGQWFTNLGLQEESAATVRSLSVGIGRCS